MGPRQRKKRREKPPALENDTNEDRNCFFRTIFPQPAKSPTMPHGLVKHMNNESIRVLLNNIEDTSRLVLFAGAGISVGVGYPLWVRATEMALDSALERGLSTAAGAYARDKLQK